MTTPPEPNQPQPPASWRTISEFTLPGEPGNDRLAVDIVADIVSSLPLSADRLENLKTAVAEATLNALEHGSQYNRDLPVAIRVRTSSSAISVGITDYGEHDIPEPPLENYHATQAAHNKMSGIELPDIDAKINGLQSPRGWGFFLIQHMVDDFHITNQPAAHTIELFLYLEGE